MVSGNVPLYLESMLILLPIKFLKVKTWDRRILFLETISHKNYDLNNWHVTYINFIWKPSVVCRSIHVLFTLFVFAFVKWCSTHIVLWFCFVCLRLVHPMFPVFLYCLFLIAPSVFSKVYFKSTRSLAISLSWWRS